MLKIIFTDNMTDCFYLGNNFKIKKTKAPKIRFCDFAHHPPILTKRKLFQIFCRSD